MGNVFEKVSARYWSLHGNNLQNDFKYKTINTSKQNCKKMEVLEGRARREQTKNGETKKKN